MNTNTAIQACKNSLRKRINKKPRLITEAFYLGKYGIIMTNKGGCMGKVISLDKEKVFSKEAELAGRIDDLIAEYNGELSLVAVMGILELKKIELFVGQE